MKKIMLLSVVVMAAIMSSQSQDLKTSTGGSATFMQPSGKYTVTMTGIGQGTAVNLLVDHCIKAKCKDPQQIGIYIVEYSEEHYTISLDEREENREGYPMEFKTLAEVKKQLKLCIKYDLTVTVN